MSLPDRMTPLPENCALHEYSVTPDSETLRPRREVEDRALPDRFLVPVVGDFRVALEGKWD